MRAALLMLPSELRRCHPGPAQEGAPEVGRVREAGDQGDLLDTGIRPLQVLTERFDAIHAGEPLEEIPGGAQFPEELQPFVGVIEKIRRRRQAAETTR